MHDVIGREAELEAVERFLGAVQERAAALVIEGEAGIGKTTLWHEGVAAAQGRGFRVLVARPAENEAKLPYAALADLVGPAFDEARSELPEPQRRALDAALLRDDAGGRTDPRTTATGLLGVLTTLAAAEPTVVAIDDVQWIDRASERALAFAARRLPARLGLLLTRRSGPSSEWLLDLARAAPEGSLETIVPAPLSLAALHHLLRSRLGGAPPRPTLIRIVEASGGNPFFALEIGRALEAHAGARALSDPLPIPQRMHELVAARVRRLSRTAREAVLVLSALSRPTVSTVADALGADANVCEALVEAEEAGVIASDGDRIRFSHPLLASAVYASAALRRRRELHRRLADVVTDPEERARHLAQGTTEPDERIAGVLERVAERSARRGAPDAAAELYEGSSRLTPSEHADELARRLVGQASALLASGDVTGARTLSAHVAASAQQAPLRVESRLLLAQIAWVDESAQAATEQLEQALGEVLADRALRGRIHAKLAMYHMEPAGVVRHADAAIELLHETQEPGLLAHALIQKFFSQVALGLGARPELLQRGLALEEQAGSSIEKSVLPLIWFKGIDDFDAARERWRVEDEWFRERGDEAWRAARLAHLAEVELHAGNWPLAERHIEESCGAIEQVATRGPWAMPLRVRAAIDAHRGRTEHARATLLPLIEQADAASDHFWAGVLLSTLGFVELTAEDHAAADRALTRMADLFESIGVADFLNDRSQPDHVEALIALGQLERARRVLAWLEARGRALPRRWIYATLPRTRALVAAAEGDLAAALATLDNAPEITALPFELARTLLVNGRLQRRAKQKRAAAETLRRTVERFDRLGAPNWTEQARRELGRVGLRPAAGWELTETERRVAELAATGRTNREVARALFMSPKTVGANLERVYRKLGINSRAELGGRMAEHRSEAKPAQT